MSCLYVHSHKTYMHKLSAHGYAHNTAFTRVYMHMRNISAFCFVLFFETGLLRSFGACSAASSCTWSQTHREFSASPALGLTVWATSARRYFYLLISYHLSFHYTVLPAKQVPALVLVLSVPYMSFFLTFFRFLFKHYLFSITHSCPVCNFLLLSLWPKINLLFYLHQFLPVSNTHLGIQLHLFRSIDFSAKFTSL